MSDVIVPPGPPYEERRKSRQRTNRWLAIVALTLLLGGGVGITLVAIELHGQSLQLRAAQTEVASLQKTQNALSTALTQEQNQVKAQGGQPSTPSAKQIIGDASTPGATGQTGATGQSGQPGPKGDQGSSGFTAPCVTSATQCVGATGPKGDKGDPGTNGTNGTNGAPGQTGPSGPMGNPGVDGTNGTNGSDGATGATGATGPAGTNPPNPTYKFPDGSAWTCSVEADGSTYDCVQSSPATTTTLPGP